MNTTKINAHIKRLKSHGIGRADIVDILSSVKGFDSNLITKSGYLTTSKAKINKVSTDILDSIESLIPTITDVKEGKSKYIIPSFDNNNNFNLVRANINIRELQKYGLTRQDILDLIKDVEDFDPNLITSDGYLDTSKDALSDISDIILKQLEEKIPTISEIMQDTSENTAEDAIEEYLAKQDITDILSSFTKQYYNIVEKIKRDKNVDIDKAESLLAQWSAAPKSGKNVNPIKDMVKWGRNYRDLTKSDSNYTYRQAKKDLKKLSKNIKNLYENAGKFLKK